MFLIKGAIATSEKDIFDKGCVETVKHEHLDLDLQAETLELLINELKVYFNVKSNTDLSINACDEQGRIDIDWHSLKPLNYSRVSKANWLKFTANEISCLYLNRISVQVEQIQVTKPLIVEAEYLKGAYFE